MKRFECFKCKKPRVIGGFSDSGPVSAPAKRAVSPHAGSRAWREQFKAGLVSKARSGSESGSASAKRRKNGSGSSSTSSSAKKKKKKRKKKKKKRSTSSSDTEDKASKKKQKKRSKSNSSSDVVGAEASQEAPAGGNDNPEVDKAKTDALEQLQSLRTVEPKDARLAQFRALLRKWHPDKNPDRVEVATEVFQFLQKGKPILGL